MSDYFRYGIIVLIMIPGSLFSQKIENIRVEQGNDQVYIYYDLSEVDEGGLLKIELFLSDNNGMTYTIEPKSVIGDIGLGVSPGKNKKIIWYPLNDLNELVGNNYKFKITATYVSRSNRISSKKSKYLGPFLGYGRYDNANNLAFGLKGVIYFGRTGIGLSAGGFASDAAYQQWESRKVLCFYGGILTEPIILKTSYFLLYVPVVINLGQIMEEFRDPGYIEAPRNSLMIGFIEAGIGFNFKISRHINCALETKYLISNNVELYDVSGISRAYQGFSADIIFRTGHFNYFK